MPEVLLHRAEIPATEPEHLDARGVAERVRVNLGDARPLADGRGDFRDAVPLHAEPDAAATRCLQANALLGRVGARGVRAGAVHLGDTPVCLPCARYQVESAVVVTTRRPTPK